MSEKKSTEQLQAEIAALQEQIKEERASKTTLSNENAKLKADNATLEQTAKEAVEAVAEAEKTPVTNRPEFKHSNKTYVLVVPKSTYTRQGKTLKVTAETLKEDKSLLGELIKKGSGVLVEKSELTYKKATD